MFSHFIPFVWSNRSIAYMIVLSRGLCHFSFICYRWTIIQDTWVWSPTPSSASSSSSSSCWRSSSSPQPASDSTSGSASVLSSCTCVSWCTLLYRSCTVYDSWTSTASDRANTSRLTDSGLMLVQRPRRCTTSNRNWLSVSCQAAGACGSVTAIPCQNTHPPYWSHCNASVVTIHRACATTSVTFLALLLILVCKRELFKSDW